jgi:hypothetical protein
MHCIFCKAPDYKSSSRVISLRETPQKGGFPMLPPRPEVREFVEAAEKLFPSDSDNTPLVQDEIQVMYLYVVSLTVRMALKIDHSTLAASILMAPSGTKIGSWGRKNGPRRRRPR